MTREIDTWNARARWLKLALEAKGDESPERTARRRLAHWRDLLAQCPSHELRAAAHEGLIRGPASEAAVAQERGCLTLSSAVGDGKTTAMAWRAYHAGGPVLWLDAVRVAIARPAELARWLDQIRDAALVLVDDVGAAGTVGQWESPRVAAILTAVVARPGPSVISTNLDRQAFGRAYDTEQGQGRLLDRLGMRPNRWVDLPPGAESRRTKATDPPGEDVLPRREARAAAFLRARGALDEAAQAFVMADVDCEAVATVARGLGLQALEDLDRAVAQHGAGQAAVDRAIADLRASWRLVVPPADPDADDPTNEPDPGAAARRRASLLDLLAYVAENQGATEADVLGQLGRTRRDLGPEDEPKLLAMVAR